jgi:hypothetical protein
MWVEGPELRWQVQRTLGEHGVDHRVLRHPPFPRPRRNDHIALTEQKLCPAIELEDGTVPHEQPKSLVAAIHDGRSCA